MGRLLERAFADGEAATVTGSGAKPAQSTTGDVVACHNSGAADKSPMPGDHGENGMRSQEQGAADPCS